MIRPCIKPFSPEDISQKDIPQKYSVFGFLVAKYKKLRSSAWIRQDLTVKHTLVRIGLRPYANRNEWAGW